MKLTNYHRNAFVKSAMNDVPKVDYEQQCRDLANKMRMAILKPLGLDKAELQRLNGSNTAWMPKAMPNMTLYGLTQEECTSISTSSAILDLCTAHENQKKARDAMSEKLKGIANGCSTRNQLVELLPEFEKYLPEDTPKPGANLPAISNLVGDFVRAGWPKNKQPATVSAKT